MKTKFLAILACAIVVVYGCSKPKKEEAKEAPVVEKPMAKETAEPGVYFKYPADGAVVSSPVFIEMGVRGREVKPAGTVEEGSGHHHILVNQTVWPEGEIIPNSDTTIHFGKGQTDTSLDLDPGEYTLSLQFANGVHQSYGEEWASSIKITVK